MQLFILTLFFLHKQRQHDGVCRLKMMKMKVEIDLDLSSFRSLSSWYEKRSRVDLWKQWQSEFHSGHFTERSSSHDAWAARNGDLLVILS